MKIAVNTLKNCMQRVFEDGPKRDRRLWIGDLRLEALANYYTFENISENISDFDISNSVDIDCAWKNSDIAVRCGEHGKSSMTPVLFTDDGGKTWYSTASLPEGYSSFCYRKQKNRR